MSSDRDQKAHYSYDDMMSALRQGGGSGGRRRRRSRQPLVEARKKKRRWLVLVSIAAISLLGLFVAILVISRSRLSTQLFREAVSHRLSEIAGVDIQCGKFIPVGISDLNCSGIEFKSETGFFRTAALTKLEAMFPAGALLEKEWNIKNLQIENADVHIIPPRAKTGPVYDVVAPQAESSSLGLGITSSPAYVTINGLAIHRLNVRIPEGRGGDYSFEDMTATGSYTDQTLRLTCSGGRLSGLFLPNLPIRSLLLTMTKKNILIESAYLELAPQVDLVLEGNIDLTEAGPAVKLTYKIEPAVLLKNLFSTTWSERLAGKLTLEEGKYEWLPGGEETFRGKFSMDGTVLEGFPANSSLCKFANSTLFNRLEYRQMKGEFTRLPDRLILSNLSGNREGEARIRGQVTSYHNGKLDGDIELDLNVPNVVVPGVKQVDSLESFPVKISGTHEKPEDNMASQLPKAE